MNYAVICPGFHASREAARVQAKVLGKPFQSLQPSATLALFFVKIVMVLPERALFSSTLGGVGRQVGIIVDMREMEVVQVHQPSIDVGFLYFEGRSTGPMPATGSHEVAEIGDGHGGIRRAEDIPVPGSGLCAQRGVEGRGIGGRSVGGGRSRWRD